MINKQKVFIQVEQNDCDFIITNIKRKITANSNDEDVFVSAKEQEGYFFTPEELKNIIGNAYAECFTNHGEDCSEEEYYKLKNEYIESLNIK